MATETWERGKETGDFGLNQTEKLPQYPFFSTVKNLGGPYSSQRKWETIDFFSYIGCGYCRQVLTQGNSLTGIAVWGFSFASPFSCSVCVCVCVCVCVHAFSFLACVRVSV